MLSSLGCSAAASSITLDSSSRLWLPSSASRVRSPAVAATMDCSPTWALRSQCRLWVRAFTRSDCWLCWAIQRLSNLIYSSAELNGERFGAIIAGALSKGVADFAVKDRCKSLREIGHMPRNLDRDERMPPEGFVRQRNLCRLLSDDCRHRAGSIVRCSRKISVGGKIGTGHRLPILRGVVASRRLRPGTRERPGAHTTCTHCA